MPPWRRSRLGAFSSKHHRCHNLMIFGSLLSFKRKSFPFYLQDETGSGTLTLAANVLFSTEIRPQLGE